ncbi:hypothetical protein KIN20_011554 [Parelaphostrongylus tenuis]|uniref:Uncharacterized protein n=1 Tax=Parelaphostrongylus tenuis TaxID=148309 RepID=A0AAD5ME83_PARTN|nr:hypothetical protein KIN20_011554 [Parelaphostrongylus tenuis]
MSRQFSAQVFVARPANSVFLMERNRGTTEPSTTTTLAGALLRVFRNRVARTAPAQLQVLHSWIAAKRAVRILMVSLNKAVTVCEVPPLETVD